MKRTLLAVAIVLLPSTAHMSLGRSPDQVAHSPIPRLHAKQRNARLAIVRQPTFTVSLQPVAFAIDGRKMGAANTRSHTSSRVDDWESYEMQAARAAVLEFARRSTQTSPEEAEQFLDRLAQLSMDKQADWLRRYQQQRDAIARAEQSREQARRSQWLSRERQQRDRIVRVAQLQTDASIARNTQASELLAANAKPFSELDFAGAVRPVYNPLIPILDPSSPQGDLARAASLLGESFAASEAALAVADAAAPAAPAAPAVPVFPIE